MKNWGITLKDVVLWMLVGIIFFDIGYCVCDREWKDALHKDFIRSNQ